MKKTIILSVFIYLLMPLVLYPQTIGVDKIRIISGSAWDLVSDLAIDNDGNYYATGSFSGQININGTSLVSAGQRDIFIIKLDSLNTIQWIKKYGGEFDEHPHSICCNNQNQLYLSGSFNNSTNLADQLLAMGGTDAFFAQLDEQGNVQWTKPLHGTSGAHKVLLETDNEGNIIIGGSFEKELQLNESTSLTAQSESDIYWAKYNATGNLLLYKHIPGDGNEYLNALIVDQENNIYLGGAYEKNIHFTPNNVNSYGKSDLFLVKYDPSGNRLWYRVAGSYYNDAIKSMSLDGKGNIYVACEFELKTRIGTPTYTAACGSDVVLIKSTVSNGAPVWIRQLGGSSKNTISSITYGNGKVYLSGNFRGEFLTGDEFKSESLFEDAYIACYTEGGTFGWFKKAGGSGEDNLWLQYQPANNKLICSGYFSDDFSIGPLHNTTNQFSDIFFGTLIDCDLLPKVDLGEDRTICYGTEIQGEGDFLNYTWQHGPVTATIIPETSGTYTIVAEDIYGCKSTDAIDITVLPSPVFELGDPVVLPEYATLFVDPGLSGASLSYLWSTGSTEPTLSISMSELSTLAIIGLTVTNGVNNCQYSDELWVSREEIPAPPMAANSTDSFADKKAGENSEGSDDEQKIEDSFNYKIYPNPSKGKLVIAGNRLKEALQIDVFNATGFHIKIYRQIDTYPFEIDLSSYTNGTYLIVISELNQTFNFKVIIE